MMRGVRRRVTRRAGFRSRWWRFAREEDGQILAIALLVLIFGGIVMVPFLMFVSTAVRSGNNLGENVKAYYAAEAGVEDAIWKLRYGNELSSYGLGAPGTPYSYTAATSVNGYAPEVTITRIMTDTAADDFESGGDSGGSGWLAGWTRTGATISSAAPYRGVYNLRLNGAGDASRYCNLPDVNEARVQFWAAVSVAVTATLDVSANGVDWSNLRTWTSADAGYVFEDLDLSPFTESTTFGFRFSTFGVGDELDVDDLRVVDATDRNYVTFDIASAGGAFPVRARVLTRGPQVVIQSWKSGN